MPYYCCAVTCLSCPHVQKATTQNHFLLPDSPPCPPTALPAQLYHMSWTGPLRDVISKPSYSVLHFLQMERRQTPCSFRPPPLPTPPTV